MKNIFDRAVSAFRIQSVFFKFSESLISLVAGCFLGATVQDKSFFWPAVIFLILFVTVQLIKFTLDKTIGESILTNLWSEHELENEKQKSLRALSNFQRITRSIQQLNQSTCSIFNVCKDDFKVYIASFLKAFLHDSGDMLSTKDSKLYLHLHVTQLAQLSGTYNCDEYVIFQNDFLGQATTTDFSREIDSVQTRAEQTNEFTIYKTQYTNLVSHVIACPIPEICEGGLTIGSIVIAANLQSSECSNLKEVLSIFAKILTNAIIKYNGCIEAEYSRTNTQKKK